MRCALIDVANNLINDVIVADPQVDPAPDGLIIVWVPEFVNPGDAWNGGVFKAPPPETPAIPAATSSAPIVDGLEML